MADFTIYEVGPRDGLQNAEFDVTATQKVDLIHHLEGVGFSGIEATAFVHPKLVPKMADASEVFAAVGDHAVLVPNQRGLNRAREAGATKFNIFYSPSEAFNERNLGTDRATAVSNYRQMLRGIPKENIRVYLSCFFGCPFEGEISESVQRECVEEASSLGSTVVLCDTVGVANPVDISEAVNHRHASCGDLALHLHHRKGRADHALSLVSAAVEGGITQIDASIGGLGGCPFMPGSGGNLATEKLVMWADVHGLDCGIGVEELDPAVRWVFKKRRQELACSGQW